MSQRAAVDRSAGGADSLLVDLGRAIRDALEDGGRSQQWLADQLGLDNASVSRMITGQVRGLSIERIRDIEDVLGLRHGHLLRAAGYIDESPWPSARDAIASDPNLADLMRSTVLAVYDMAVVTFLGAGMSAAEPGTHTREGSSTAPTAPKRKRS